MKFLISLLLLFPGALAWGRWATPSEVPLLVRKLHRETIVNADGTARETWKWVLRVQRPEAREEVGTRSIRFYKSFEEVKVLRAGTRTKGKWTPMPLSDLQERSVNDESPGFSSLHEYILSFSDVQEGSDVEFDYEIVTHRALEPGFWGQNFSLASGAYEDFQWKISSRRPLTTAAQDSTGLVRLTSNSAKTEVQIKSQRPFSLALADEDEPYLTNQRGVLLMVGLLEDWKSYGVVSAKAFEAKVQGKLAVADLEFLKKLRTEKSRDRQIQKILARIQERFRYFGDWRATEQMYVPRSLDEINRTSYGDCKDFALLAVKMLRELGFEAKPVWIMNTETDPGSFMYRFPTDNAFNHVIVRVGLGKHSWWVDPTNPAARVHYLADEIAGRYGLVLDEKGSELQMIRPLVAEDYRTQVTVEVFPEKDGVTRVLHKARFEAFSQVPAGEQIKLDGAKTFIAQQIQRVMPQASLVKVRSEEIELHPETNDLRSVGAEAELENFWVRTSAGLGFSLPREEIVESLRKLLLEGRVGDLFLGKVYSHRESFFLRGFELSGNESLACSVQSPWLDYEQKIEKDPKGLVLRTKFDLKSSEISYGTKERNQVRKLQKELRNCPGRQLLLVRVK